MTVFSAFILFYLSQYVLTQCVCGGVGNLSRPVLQSAGFSLSLELSSSLLCLPQLLPVPLCGFNNTVDFFFQWRKHSQHSSWVLGRAREMSFLSFQSS